jgi:cellulose synthase/poly-beta-1,6-N-acetylglucosamine synthase-like glycosyltransferase
VTTSARADNAHDELCRFVRDLSNDSVIAVDRSGPVFSTATERPRKPAPDTFVWALPHRTRMAVRVLSAGWGITFALFWIWWCLPVHRTSWATFAANTVILFLISVLPLYFLITVNRLRRVSPALDIPRLRVAMVVTKAPSEPWSLVRDTLEGMLAQEFPYHYDVWLCDEKPSAESLEWCSDNGVRVSTRWEVEAYLRDEWPRRRRCKEGNLAYFYDRYGYRDYDVVSQLDADHVPEPSYLAEMVRPFGDSAIGYVAAPSVCGKNRSDSWTVRGRLFDEKVFHGPYQLGHNHGLAPICIGSHYAVRTQALASIGGIGPELAEDFSTSYLMYVAGWTGAFAIDAHAHGDGPPDFSAMVTQEFQWARSLCTILLGLVPRTLRRLQGKVRMRFAFAVSWYPFSVATLLGGLALTAAAPILGIQWVRVNYFEFIAFSAALSFWLVLLHVVLRRQQLLRPNDAPIVSWEGVLYVLTRWPYNAWGLVAALIQKIAPRSVDLEVTPKNVTTVSPLPLRNMMPYLMIVSLLSGAALAGMGRKGLVGYVGLCLLAAISYGVVCLAIPILHGYEKTALSPTPLREFARLVGNTLPVCSVTLVPLVMALYDYPVYFLQEVSI